MADPFVPKDLTIDDIERFDPDMAKQIRAKAAADAAAPDLPDHLRHIGAATARVAGPMVGGATLGVPGAIGGGMLGEAVAEKLENWDKKKSAGENIFRTSDLHPLPIIAQGATGGLMEGLPVLSAAKSVKASMIKGAGVALGGQQLNQAANYADLPPEERQKANFLKDYSVFGSPINDAISIGTGGLAGALGTGIRFGKKAPTPEAPVSGAAPSTNSVTPVVNEAAERARLNLPASDQLKTDAGLDMAVARYKKGDILTPEEHQALTKKLEEEAQTMAAWKPRTATSEGSGTPRPSLKYTQAIGYNHSLQNAPIATVNKVHENAPYMGKLDTSKEDTATVKMLQGDLDQSQANRTQADKETVSRLNDDFKRQQANKAEDLKTDANTEKQAVAAQKLWDKKQLEEKKLAEIEAAKEGRVETEPSISESISATDAAGKRQSMRKAFVIPQPEEGEGGIGGNSTSAGGAPAGDVDAAALGIDTNTGEPVAPKTSSLTPNPKPKKGVIPVKGATTLPPPPDGEPTPGVSGPPVGPKTSTRAGRPSKEEMDAAAAIREQEANGITLSADYTDAVNAGLATPEQAAARTKLSKLGQLYNQYQGEFKAGKRPEIDARSAGAAASKANKSYRSLTGDDQTAAMLKGEVPENPARVAAAEAGIPNNLSNDEVVAQAEALPAKNAENPGLKRGRKPNSAKAEATAPEEPVVKSPEVNKPGTVFARQPKGDNSKRFTPEVMRTLEEMADEITTHPAMEVGSDGIEATPKGGKIGVVHPTTYEMGRNAPFGKKGQVGVNMTNAEAHATIMKALNEQDISSNRVEGAVRAAEQRLAKAAKGDIEFDPSEFEPVAESPVQKASNETKKDSGWKQNTSTNHSPQRVKEADVPLPGAEGVRGTENPTPAVAEVLFALEREAARAPKGAQGSLLEAADTPEGVSQGAEGKTSPEAPNARQSVKSEKGFGTLPLTAHLAGAGVGAAVGAAEDKENRTEGALTGAMAGGLGVAALPKVANVLKLVSSNPKGAAEAVGDLGKKIYRATPAIQRFDLLSKPSSIFANTLAPWAAGLIDAGEKTAMAGANTLFKGQKFDRSGIDLAKELTPGKVLPSMKTAWQETSKRIDDAERGERHLTTTGNKTLDKVLQGPGQMLGTGDEAVREGYQRAGLGEAAGRLGTSTNEPYTGIGKNVNNFGKAKDAGDNPATLAKLMLPFKRTSVNILEQSMERTPVVGYFMHNPEDLHTMLEKTVQQAGGAGVFYVAKKIGEHSDPSDPNSKTIRKFVTNFAGRYGSLAAAGFAIGQAEMQGRSDGSLLGKDGLTGLNAFLRDLPMPSTEVIPDTVKSAQGMLRGEPAHPDRTGVAKWVPRWTLPASISGTSDSEAEIIDQLLKRSLANNDEDTNQ